MDNIVFGGGRCSSGTPSGPDGIAICDIYDRVTVADVRIVHTQSSAGELGFAGRSGGPEPIILVALKDFQFFLGGPLVFANLTMAPFTITNRGEDLSTSGSGC